MVQPRALNLPVFQIDFLVNIILLIGRNVKGNLRPAMSFLWKSGMSLLLGEFVVDV